MEPAFTLANIPLDLQITICIHLHPSDILALRKTCKALEIATRQRIVWVAVLHRVCLDNSLFLPSFPIPDMSALELERAAMGPRRWIELCGALQKGDSTFSVMQRPRTTRFFEDAGKLEFFIVPGGRYLVTAGDGLSVWDLGYVSTVDCKLVASVASVQRKRFMFMMVQATPDGEGLVILQVSCATDRSDENFHLSFFEIYPRSEKPLLTQIARFSSKGYPIHILPDTVICRVFHDHWIFFRVVDFRTNYSTCFTADVTLMYDAKTLATKTAIIVIGEQRILIWAIPPLSPQSSDLPDDFRDHNPTLTLIPPLFKIPLPDTLPISKRLPWETPLSWYFEFEETVYFDMISETHQRFKIIIKPDLSDASLHAINMPETIPDELKKALNMRDCTGYRICDDALVYSWNDLRTWQWEALTSAPFTKVFTRWDGEVKSLCPASGRFISYERTGTIGGRKMVVVDLF